MDHKLIADALFIEVEKYVSTRTAEMASAMEALQAQITELSERAAVPFPSDPGPQGPQGDRGEKGDVGEKGADGLNGIKGADGINGTDGTNGIDGKDGVGIQGEKGIDGREGRDGEPGRDAIHIDVIDGIDPAKKYQRGTFAAFRGGIVRSFRATDQMCQMFQPVDGDLEKHGWHVVVRGVDALSIEAADDLRTFTMRSVMTDGSVLSKSVQFPVLIYRGLYKSENEYAQGDCATWGGSLWIAEKNAPSNKPGEGDGWKLAVKKGRDGK